MREWRRGGVGSVYYGTQRIDRQQGELHDTQGPKDHQQRRRMDLEQYDLACDAGYDQGAHGRHLSRFAHRGRVVVRRQQRDVRARNGGGRAHGGRVRALRERAGPLAAQEPLQPDRELRRAAYGDHAAVPRGGHRRAAVHADEQPLRHRVRLAGSRQVSPGASRMADRPAE